jgi:hypothetical protein
MAQTSIGLVFLYDLGDADIFAYAQRTAGTALQRVRGLLERIASKSSGPDGSDQLQTLSARETEVLTPAEIDSLIEIYLGSPKNQWYEAKSQDANYSMVRGEGESAVAYLDRLINRYASVAPHGGRPSVEADNVGELITKFAATIQASQESIQSTLRWAAGAFVIALAALGGGAAWLAYQSQVRDRDNDRKTQAWQEQMKMIADNNTAMEKGFTELAAENARLKERIQILESRPLRAPKPAASPALRSAPPRTPAKASKPFATRR